MKLTESHLDIMRHSLGIRRPGDEGYRNHFCAGDEHADMPLIRDLVAENCMALLHRINGGRDGIYVVTEAGRRALQGSR